MCYLVMFAKYHLRIASIVYFISSIDLLIIVFYYLDSKLKNDLI